MNTKTVTKRINAYIDEAQQLVFELEAASAGLEVGSLPTEHCDRRRVGHAIEQAGKLAVDVGLRAQRIAEGIRVASDLLEDL